MVATKIHVNEGVRRAGVLDFIATYIAANGYGPSLREIAAGVGLASVSSAEHHVAQLETAGLVTRAARVSRSIRIAA